MKTAKRTGILGILLLWMCILASYQQAKAQGGGSISFQTFYDELAPYGQWVVHPQYGSVWIPAVEQDFRPYASNGHWIMTEYGNTWVSDYVWGWAPFHYGRWFYDDYDGWVWVPGDEWGPAWVAWRSGGGYYGWAPLGPGMNINVSINIPAIHWVFVPQIHIASPYIYRYCAPRPRIVHIYNRTVYIRNTYRYNNRVYVCGPYRHEIERTTRRTVPVHRIESTSRPGRPLSRNGSIAMYRPEVSSPRQVSGRETDHSQGNNRQTPGRADRNSRIESQETPYTQHTPANNPRGNSANQPRENRASNSREERNQGNAGRTGATSSSPDFTRESRSESRYEQPTRQPSTASRQRTPEPAQHRSQVSSESRSQRQPQTHGETSPRQRSSRTESEKARRNE
ncbi:hypothetical protein Q0590_31835 [Rhodocytophaga aerolata]|uniref:BcpO-related WXXGXW repeat protein n=1 Tax=Rhodocytophaga aerolata TaxID=455078 RepID=A0ABT8RHQ0_9BACT|nr:DUF6600 domain-containing protein [Rhodocytophaga aerolata]MDO1450909.1 hypothetical protein [Rhodocytophaga aerolata]